MKHLALLVFGLSLAMPAAASVRRIEVTKETLAASGIQLTVERLPPDGGRQTTLLITFPPAQAALAELWKIELWLLQDGRTVLAAPLDVERDRAGHLSVRFTVSDDLRFKPYLAVRVGKNAPVDETIYQVDVESFIRADKKGQ